MSTDPELARLRSEIDEVEGAVWSLLGERFELTREVGRLKATLGLPPTDQDRETEIRSRIVQTADQHGVNPDLALLITQAILNRVKTEHEAIQQGVPIEELAGVQSPDPLGPEFS